MYETCLMLHVDFFLKCATCAGVYQKKQYANTGACHNKNSQKNQSSKNRYTDQLKTLENRSKRINELSDIFDAID